VKSGSHCHSSSSSIKKKTEILSRNRFFWLASEKLFFSVTPGNRFEKIEKAQKNFFPPRKTNCSERREVTDNNALSLFVCLLFVAVCQTVQPFKTPIPGLSNPARPPIRNSVETADWLLSQPNVFDCDDVKKKRRKIAQSGIEW
jgi:hypothetical protein